MTIFISGEQKRVKRPLTIDGMDVDEFIRRNADPIWLHQNEMWEDIDPIPREAWQVESGLVRQKEERASKDGRKFDRDDEDDIPF